MSIQVQLYQWCLEPLPFVLQSQVLEYLFPNYSSLLRRPSLFQHIRRRYCKFCGDFLENHPLNKQKPYSFHLSCYHRRYSKMNVPEKYKSSTHYRIIQANIISSLCTHSRFGIKYETYSLWNDLFISLYLVCHMKQPLYYYRFSFKHQETRLESMINLYNYNIYTNPKIAIVPPSCSDFYREQILLPSQVDTFSFFSTKQENILQLCLYHYPLIYVFRKMILEHFEFYHPLYSIFPRFFTQWMIRKYYPHELSKFITYLQYSPISFLYLPNSMIQELWRKFPADIYRLYLSSINLSCILEFY